MAQGEAPRREIDWGAAEATERALSVPLTGEASKEWSEYASHVLDRLRGGTRAWGEIEVGEERIEVADVQEGAEGDLRHLLESVVLQANAHFAPAEDEGGEGDDDGAPEDASMTAAFRAFADDQDDDED